jgi:hypothetical protein
VKDWYSDTQWKEAWDVTRRLPSAERGGAYRRDRQLYQPEVGQFFRRKEDDLLVEVLWWCSSGIAVVRNARTKEWYSTFTMEFSTRRVVWKVDRWEDLHLSWTRVNQGEARTARRAYIRTKTMEWVYAVLPFLRKDNAS